MDKQANRAANIYIYIQILIYLFKLASIFTHSQFADQGWQRHSRVPTCPPFLAFGAAICWVKTKSYHTSMPTDCYLQEGSSFFLGRDIRSTAVFRVSQKPPYSPDIISFFLRSKACAWNFNRAWDTPQVWCFIASCYIMLYQCRSQS